MVCAELEADPRQARSGPSAHQNAAPSRRTDRSRAFDEDENCGSVPSFRQAWIDRKTEKLSCGSRPIERCDHVQVNQVAIGTTWTESWLQDAGFTAAIRRKPRCSTRRPTSRRDSRLTEFTCCLGGERSCESTRRRKMTSSRRRRSDGRGMMDSRTACVRREPRRSDRNVRHDRTPGNGPRKTRGASVT